MEGILNTKPEITAEYLARLYRQNRDSDNENIIFANGGFRRKHICTCGHVFDDRTCTMKCPECGTTKRVYFTNSTKKPARLTLVVYYRTNVEDDDNFSITRYDLTYVVDDLAEKIERRLKEHSKLIYSHQEDKTYIIINGKKNYDISRLARHSLASIVEVFSDEIAEVVNCKNFFLKTGFKELTETKRYKRWNVNDLINYLKYYKNEGNNGVEILLKAGFETMAIEAFERNIPMNQGTKLHDFVRLPKSIMHIIKDLDYGSVKFLERCHQIQPVTREQVEWVQFLRSTLYGYTALTKLDELLSQGYTLNELINYTEKADLYQAIPPDETISLLSDYVHMAVLAQLPYERFPNSLKKAHDLMARQVQFVQAKASQERFQETTRQYKWLEYHDNQYFIKVPDTPDELIFEGQKLHHCVASYVTRVANNQTMVVFLRRASDPQTPFYTIEVCNKYVIQVRGFANRRVLSESVVEFLRKWCEEKGLICYY